MLEEMKAYAEQAVRIAELDRKCAQLEEQVALMYKETLSKEQIKKWFLASESYLFVADTSKQEIRELLFKELANENI